MERWKHGAARSFFYEFSETIWLCDLVAVGRSKKNVRKRVNLHALCTCSREFSSYLALFSFLISGDIHVPDILSYTVRAALDPFSLCRFRVVVHWVQISPSEYF